MLRSLPLILGQLPDPRIVRVLIRSLTLTLLLFACLWWGLDALLTGVDTSGWPAWLRQGYGAGDDWLALPIVLLALFFLFPAVATTVIGLFLDDVVAAVEDRHYPHAPAAHPVGIARNVGLALASGARVLLWNLLALPLYVLLLFTGVGAFLLFLAINGWLLGRDYLEMVAARHLRHRPTLDWLRAHRAQRFAVGLVTSLLFLVPFANLLAPVIGAALATHAFHANKPEVVHASR